MSKNSIMYYVLGIMQKSFRFKSLFLLVLPIILATYFILQTATTASAQSPLPTSIPPTSPIYTDMIVHNLFHTFSCLAVGSSVIGQPCLTYQVTKDAQGAIQSIPILSSANLQGGLLGTATGLIAGLYANPPVRSADYLASVGQDLGFVKNAKAQVIGSGASVLSPILNLWQVSRNISYVIMILIFVIIGLMVMFRQKINPQTVITAQAALPGLVIGLIMITFSYFIAGLIADTAFIGTNLVGYYFQAAQNKPPQNLAFAINEQNILTLFSPFTKIASISRIHDALASVWDSLAIPTASNVNPFAFGPQQLLITLSTMLIAQFILPFGAIGGGIGQLISGSIAVGFSVSEPLWTIGIALSFVAMAILIYTMFKLLLALISTYVSIIFLTATAPFSFLAASLPGRQGLATSWILSMLGNVLVFPAVIAVLYFVAYIMGPVYIKENCTISCPFNISQTGPKEYSNFAPVAKAAAPEAHIVGSATFPLLGGFDLDFVRLLLAFGALVALPSIPEIIKRTIGTVSQAGQLIGQEIGSGIGSGQRYSGQAQQGIQGFAGQVGRVTDDKGYILTPDGFKRPQSTQEMMFSGAKPGLISKTKGLFKSKQTPKI